MSLLLETIRVIHNSFQNLDYHNFRVNNSRKKLLGTNDSWDLKNIIKLPELNSSLIYKCRFIYLEEVISVEFHPYSMKPLKSLTLVDFPDFKYNHKYLERNKLEALKATNSTTDDILIVQYNKVTDCSYANIIFDDGNKWITPSTPLLRGTKRQLYIDNHIITEQEVTTADLKRFSRARIINAMIDLEESPDISIQNIV